MFDTAPRYYASQNEEIDFLLQKGMDIIPVEVKAGERKSAPSFKRYIAREKPTKALRFSQMGYKKDGGITNLPLYLAGKTGALL
jgi:predicted AAA+ superfamily ATPase